MEWAVRKRQTCPFNGSPAFHHIIGPMATSAPPMFYLIDGHAQIFRAYYAIRGGMSSPVTGEPTQAIFAFAGMLLKLFDQYRPEYVAMAIDLPGRTFRDDLYDEYKANREPTPDDFRSQEQRIFELTRLFGIPLLSAPGAEADDVIATVTQRILDNPDHNQLQIRIVSRDKDLEQLLSPRVSMFDIHKDRAFDMDALQTEKGIRPDQVIDMQALTGDTADNIPGVDGIGPKTAAKLINEYGSIDQILANLEKIKGKRRQNIEAARDRLALNRTLVTLKRDLDLEFDLQNSRWHPDVATLCDLFRNLGFRRHITDLNNLVGASTGDKPTNPANDNTQFQEFLFAPDSLASPANGDEPTVPEGHTTAADYDYRAVTTQAELDELVAQLKAAPIISVDTETTGLTRQAKICGLSFAWEPGQAVYVPILSPQPSEHLDAPSVLGTLRSVLEDTQVPKCGHNLKYDAVILRQAGHNGGVALRGIAFDSMIASHLLGYTSRSLDHLADRLLQHAMIPIRRLIGSNSGQQTRIDQVPLEQVVPYAAEDADLALRLHYELATQIESAGMQQLAEVEMPLAEVLAEMEGHGIRVNSKELLRQKEVLTDRIAQLRSAIYEAAGEPFNLDSPKQLAHLLFTKLGLPTIKRGKTGPSTDVEVLERLANREDLPQDKLVVPRLIVDYRQFAKLVNTYLDNLRQSIHKDDGRIHASFVQLGAATGRLSSGGPNLQNIPVRTEAGRQIRSAFVAEPGHLLICADYSQIELRFLAHLSEDPALIKAFEQDLDIHTAVAAEVFGIAPGQVTADQRSNAKVVNFGIIYGITAYGLARRIKGLDERSAQKLINDYRKRFAGIDRFLHRCVAQALDKGYVETILGRRRHIQQFNSRNAATRALGERLAINTVVQGSATGDLIKTSMVNIQRRIHRDRLPLKMLVQIHDELLFEAPADAAEAQAKIVRSEMEGAMQLRIPLKVDIGIGPNWLDAK